jgi:DNA-binding transcriptional ArsR family regulator
MLEPILGSRSAQQVLLYLHNYEEGYALGIARTFGLPLSSVQKQLRKFESGGVVVSRLVGRTRVYTWNPRYPLRHALRALLGDTLKYVPRDEVRAYYRERRRPRRSGKSL